VRLPGRSLDFCSGAIRHVRRPGYDLVFCGMDFRIHGCDGHSPMSVCVGGMLGLPKSYAHLSDTPLRGFESGHHKGVQYGQGRKRGRDGCGFQPAKKALVRGLPLPRVGYRLPALRPTGGVGHAWCEPGGMRPPAGLQNGDTNGEVRGFQLDWGTRYSWG